MKDDFGRNGYYHIQLPHARRLVIDLLFGLHFEGEEPFTDPERLPRWTADYDRVCRWLS